MSNSLILVPTKNTKKINVLNYELYVVPSS